jgi:hypothetical protein
LSIGKRFRLTIKGVTYDLSPEQFEFLSQKSFKLPKVIDWNTEQRVKGLIKFRLFTKQPRSYQRTSLGEKVFNAICERIQNQPKF